MHNFQIIIYTNFIANILDTIYNFKSKNVFFKQLTIWNIISQFIDPYNSIIIINSINIFIIFHLFFVFEPYLYYSIPKKLNISIFQFHIGNFILHFIPLIISLIILNNNYINITLFDVFYYFLYIFIWLINVKFINIYSIKFENSIKFLILIIFLTLINQIKI
jgi:hypothetical protein